MEKTDRWAFTLNTQPLINLKYVRFLVYQKEKGERTEYEHYQGYIEFYKPYTLQYVKSLFKSKQIHLEPARESRAVNVIYCTKEKTYTGGRFIYTTEKQSEEDDNKLVNIETPQGS